MILYTPLSESDIFPVSENERKKRKVVSFQGKSVYAEELDDGSWKLLQLLSTDPQDFLDENLSPGMILR